MSRACVICDTFYMDELHTGMQDYKEVLGSAVQKRVANILGLTTRVQHA